MTYFKSYDGSDVSKALGKIASDAEARSKTVEADVKRIKPKLGQYKKETLEKLIKETEKARHTAFDAGFDKVIHLADSYRDEAAKLKKQLLATEQKRFEDATVEARKTLQAAVAAIESEYRANLEGVDGDLSDLNLNPNNAKSRLDDAYEELITLFKQELKKASAERQPSGDRKI